MTLDTRKGDAFSILPTLAGRSVDSIISDPPYDLDSDQKAELVNQCFRISRGHVLLFCSPENQFAAPKYLFWVKPTSTKNFSKNHGRFVEMVAFYQRGDTFNQLYWANMTGVYSDILECVAIHPYQKPASLMERLVNIHTNRLDTVLDPFMGSGATGIACAKLGRNFIGVEQDDTYFGMATERINEALSKELT